MSENHNQKGIALLVLVLILAFAFTAYTINSIETNGIDQKREAKTSEALAEAKAALLGEVVRVEEAELGSKITEAIYFPNPDSAGSLGEGIETSNLGIREGVVLGRLPWRDLDIHPIKDGWGECLWYVVSGSYKRRLPTNLLFNWDRQGQIDLIDVNGNAIATNVVALIISPGPVLDGQNRELTDDDYKQCGGNYNAINYLDPFNNVMAIGGNVNYFPGSPDNRSLSTTSNATFVQANNENYNDQFILITVDDVFDFLVKRSDFINEINAQIINAEADIINAGLAPSLENKGTDGFDCSASSLTTDQTFCQNWKEMFLFANVLPGVTVNGVACNKVLIFGGKRIGTQVRVSPDDKSNPANYLEGDNLEAFNGVPGKNYVGSNQFTSNNPSADVVMCIS